MIAGILLLGVLRNEATAAKLLAEVRAIDVRDVNKVSGRVLLHLLDLVILVLEWPILFQDYGAVEGQVFHCFSDSFAILRDQTFERRLHLPLFGRFLRPRNIAENLVVRQLSRHYLAQKLLRVEPWVVCLLDFF